MAEKKCVMCGHTGSELDFVEAKPLYTHGFKQEAEAVCRYCYGAEDEELPQPTDEIKFTLEPSKRSERKKDIDGNYYDDKFTWRRKLREALTGVKSDYFKISFKKKSKEGR